jgi:hypothetical protein
MTPAQTGVIRRPPHCRRRRALAGGGRSELRGGTHVVVRQAERPPAPGAGAPFDLMVDDVDAAHRDYAEKRLSPIRRGRIHDSFDLAGPDGWAFTVNSSHASDQPI